MKNLKNYLKITLQLVFAFIMSCSCSKDEKTETTTINPINQTITPALKCFISGETVSNAETNDAFSTVLPGTTTNYKYSSTFVINNVDWTIVSSNPAGSITINNTTNPNANISFASNFVSGTIKAVGNDIVGQLCGPVLNIKK